MKRSIFILTLILAVACNSNTEPANDNNSDKSIVTWDDPGLIDHW